MGDTHSIEDVKCIAETDAALRVTSDEIGTEWIPKSQIDDDSEVFALGGEGTLVVTLWLAETKGWV